MQNDLKVKKIRQKQTETEGKIECFYLRYQNKVPKNAHGKKLCCMLLVQSDCITIHEIKK